MPKDILSYVNNLKRNRDLTRLQQDVIDQNGLNKLDTFPRAVFIPKVLKEFPWEIFSHFYWNSIKKDYPMTYRDAMFYNNKLQEIKFTLERLNYFGANYLVYNDEMLFPLIPKYLDTYIKNITNAYQDHKIPYGKYIDVKDLERYSNDLKLRLNKPIKQQIDQLTDDLKDIQFLNNVGSITELNRFGEKHSMTNLNLSSYVEPVKIVDLGYESTHYLSYFKLDHPFSEKTSTFRIGLDKDWKPIDLSLHQDIQIDAIIIFNDPRASMSGDYKLTLGFNEEKHEYYIAK